LASTTKTSLTLSIVMAMLGGFAMPTVASDVADAVMRGAATAARLLLAERGDVNAAQADGATAA
jgi:hypothetical protein